MKKKRDKRIEKQRTFTSSASATQKMSPHQHKWLMFVCSFQLLFSNSHQSVCVCESVRRLMAMDHTHLERGRKLKTESVALDSGE